MIAASQAGGKARRDATTVAEVRMVDLTLTQSEADALIAMEKHRANADPCNFPRPGESVTLALQSVDKREHFLLDLRRSRIDLAKVTMQNRARQVVILARLDLGGAPHRNPDDEEIPTPHLHVYREGYGDKWAVRVPPDQFRNTSDAWMALEDFLRFCHITQPPIINRDLFT